LKIEVDVDPTSTWQDIFSAIKPKAPNKVYAIAFTPRSGSTWLGQLLLGSASFGDPKEFFNFQAASYVIRNSGCDNLNSYYEYLRTVKQSDNGVFGYEIAYQHVAKVVSEGFGSLFEDADCWFYLRRRDFIAQAVSLYRAQHSGLYHSYQIEDKVPETPFDAAKIKDIALGIMAAEYNWQTFFRERDIQEAPLWYEDLVTLSEVQIIDEFRVALKLPNASAPDTGKRNQNLERVSDAHSTLLTERFSQEEASFIAYWNLHRGSKMIAEYRREIGAFMA